MHSSTGSETDDPRFALLRYFPEGAVSEEVSQRVARGRDSLGFFLGPADRRRLVFKRAVNLDRVIAVRQRNRIVGHATFYTLGRGPFSPAARDFTGEYGWLLGWARFLAFRLSEPSLARGELYLYTLKMDAKLRGQGGGTVLLEAVTALATESGCTAITLHVAGHNPAVSLYHRNGFVVAWHLKIGPLRRFFPFSDVLKMKKVLR